MNAPRSEVVELMLDLRNDSRRSVSNWRHWDGRKQTPAERRLIESATLEDFEAAIEIGESMLEAVTAIGSDGDAS